MDSRWPGPARRSTADQEASELHADGTLHFDCPGPEILLVLQEARTASSGLSATCCTSGFAYTFLRSGPVSLSGCELIRVCPFATAQLKLSPTVPLHDDRTMRSPRSHNR